MSDLIDAFFATNIETHRPIITPHTPREWKSVRDAEKKRTHVKVFGHWCRADLVGCSVWLYYDGIFATIRLANYSHHIVGLAMCEEDRAWYDNQLKRARRKALRMQAHS